MVGVLRVISDSTNLESVEVAVIGPIFGAKIALAVYGLHPKNGLFVGY